ncbi:hypothetical protein N7465_009028 [Penicillium sp. CMV-2018d]|nr:hypothetical protein N7465_009028 [Penicillium sp. CMV-2018d]
MVRLIRTQVENDMRAISHVSVVVHTLGQAGPTTSDNHWSIYLILADNSGSVRVNMAAEYGDTTGHLVWTNHSYALTTSALKNWDFVTTPGTTVASIAMLIYAKGRDKYQMSGGGSGCRYWVYTITYDLSWVRCIAENCYSILWPHLQFQYHRDGGLKSLNWVEGTFNA